MVIAFHSGSLHQARHPRGLPRRRQFWVCVIYMEFIGSGMKFGKLCKQIMIDVEYHIYRPLVVWNERGGGQYGTLVEKMCLIFYSYCIQRPPPQMWKLCRSIVTSGSGGIGSWYDLFFPPEEGDQCNISITKVNSARSSVSAAGTALKEGPQGMLHEKLKI